MNVPISLSNLKPAYGSRHRPKLLGRGEGSGHGQTSTRGMKGQRSRSGDTRMMGFEGGQTPLLRRIPKRGFRSPSPRRFAVVHLDQLERHFASGDRVTPEELRRLEIVKKSDRPIKLLGDGTLTKSLVVCLPAASLSARRAVEKALGQFEAVVSHSAERPALRKKTR